MTKNFRLRPMDYFVLWAGAGVSLADLWAGGGQVTLGFWAGVAMILVGHLVGNTMIFAAGHVSSKYGLSGMESLRPSFGLHGAKLGAVANGLQLIGWTAIMLLIGTFALEGILDAFNLSFKTASIIAIMGLFTTLWSLVKTEAWKWVQRASMVLLFAVCTYVAWHIVASGDLAAVMALPAKEGTLTFKNLGSQFDLVLGFVISWVPLAGDYARFSGKENAKKAAVAGWAGYFLTSSFFFVLGLMIALRENYDVLATGYDAVGGLITLLKSYELFIPLAVIIVFSTFTTTFLDIYSGAISLQSIFPKAKESWLSLIVGALGTLAALVFQADIFTYEGFLLAIGSVLIPMFSIMLTDSYFLRKDISTEDAHQTSLVGEYAYTKGVHLPAIAAWGLGFATFYACKQFGVGASLPAYAVAALSYAVLFKLKQ